MISFWGQNCLEAWQNAVSGLLRSTGDKLNNVIVEIENGGIEDPLWIDEFNPKDCSADGESIKDVANTIFPQRTWERLQIKGESRHELYRRYPIIYENGKHFGQKQRRNKTAWGTYFLRLVKFGNSNVNQLENAISAISNWPGNYRGAITFHLSSPEYDSYRRRGGPCWHFAELGCTATGEINFSVVYRSHDYFNRTLGNFIGLSRLLNFICQETGKRPGKLVCQSVYAWHSFSKNKMRELAGL